MNPKSLSRRRRSAGFTLLEILIVVTLVALLMGVLIKSLMGGRDAAEYQIAKSAVSGGMAVPLESYRIGMGSYPSTEEGLQALITAPASNTGGWRGPYLQDAGGLKDPWGTTYRYAYPGTHNTTRYDIWSAGPDKKDGTPDDVGNWATTGTTP